MNNLLVSIIIPVYNREASIRRSIDSALEQTYTPLEVIVVDDGSTDRTVSIVEEYGNQIRLVRQANQGPSAARNAGVAHSMGEILSFLDSDDSWRPEKLERQVRLMEHGGMTVVCCICNAAIHSDKEESDTSFRISDVESKISEGYWLNPAQIIATRFVLFNQVVSIRRHAFEQVRGFDETLRLLEDHDLAYRLAGLGPWAFISEKLVDKFNGSDGIGVIAMRDPEIHLKAWTAVLMRFLEDPSATKHGLKGYLRSSLIDGRLEIKALGFLEDKLACRRIQGLALQCFVRIRRGVRRRLPWWPRVKACQKLDGISQ